MGKACGLKTVKIACSLDPVHSNSRYIDLLKRMSLPQ